MSGRSDLVLRSLALGAVSGLRTMTGVTAVFRSGRWRVLLPVMALGEYVVDMLPKTPARTEPGPLAARAIAGALCGAGMASDAGGNVPLCAATGSAGAIGAAYIGVAFRTWSVGRLPPVFAALLEDAVAIAVAATAVRGRSEKRGS